MVTLYITAYSIGAIYERWMNDACMHGYMVNRGMMGLPTEDTLLPSSGMHCTPGEVTWHRHFLLMAERHFRKLVNNPSFGLPYWNFTRYNII